MMRSGLGTSGISKVTDCGVVLNDKFNSNHREPDERDTPTKKKCLINLSPTLFLISSLVKPLALER